MRFTGEKKLMEAYWNNTEKKKTKFLWWPITIGGETRWLETAEIVYRVQCEDAIFLGKIYSWEPREFVNN